MPVRRALIGFSSPVGYSYAFQAPRSANDGGSSPNPVLMGSMGLFTLYDELWFACESLCPRTMRGLPYVHVVDRETPGLAPEAQGFRDFTREVKFSGKADLNDLFPGGYREMEQFFGPGGAVDNHTHGLRFYDTGLNGNPGRDQLAFDIWLIEHLRHLELDLVLNPLTAKVAFDGDVKAGALLRQEMLDELLMADAIVSLRNLYDITGADGPYHPCIEEIRADELLVAFRHWLADESGRLGNQELKDVQREVDARIFDLMQSAILAHADQFHPKQVFVDLIKDKLSEVVGIPWSLIEYLGRVPRAREQRAYAFVARALLQQEMAVGGRRG
jgi:hypothetical protein